MAGRPRKVSDKDILAAAVRVILRMGPVRMTLADVGAEIGLGASTLIQRFGSKRGLLLAVARDGADDVERVFNRAAETEPLAARAVSAAYAALCASIRTPDELAHSLAFLQIDLTDPEFLSIAREHKARVLDATARLLRRAIPEREPDDVAAAAEAVHALYSGTLIAWAIDGAGTLAERVATAIDRYLTRIIATA